jgi:hypothetical protein
MLAAFQAARTRRLPVTTSGPFGLEAREYFRSHAIDPEVAASVGVYQDGGEIVYPGDRRRSLNGGAKVKGPAGKPLVPWWASGRPEGEAMTLVTEGESDALAALSALPHAPPAAGLGDLPVVAIPGTGFPPARLADELAAVGCRQAWLAFDADDAGRSYTEKAIEALRARRIRPFPVELPEGSDLADCLAAADEPGEWIANVLFDTDPLEEPTPEPGAWLERADHLLLGPAPGPAPFLVESLLMDRVIAAILGTYKAGKTWLDLELAISITTGQPAFGQLAVTRPGPVIIVLEESGRDALHRRLDALVRGRCIPPASLAGLHFAANRRVRLDEQGWRDRLLEAADLIRPRAIIFDPFVRVKGATVDENVQREVAPILDFLRDLRDESGATVVFTHHTGHHNRERMRGSSDLEGYWESKILLKRDDDGVCTVAADHREAEASDELRYRLDWDEHSRSMRLAPLEGSEQPAPTLRELVVAHVEIHPGEPTDAIAKGLGRRREDVAKILRDGEGDAFERRPSEYQDAAGRRRRRDGWHPASRAAPLTIPLNGTGTDAEPVGREGAPRPREGRGPVGAAPWDGERPAGEEPGA